MTLITIRKWTKDSEDQYWINLNTSNDNVMYRINFQDRILGAMVFQDFITIIKKYYNCQWSDILIKDDCIEINP